jgi:hypothetical protein
MRLHLQFKIPHRHTAREDDAMADITNQAKDAINDGADRATKAAEAVAPRAGEVMGDVRG